MASVGLLPPFPEGGASLKSSHSRKKKSKAAKQSGGSAPAVYVIHENEEWMHPLRTAFESIGLSVVEWNIGNPEDKCRQILDFNTEPPHGIFYNRMSASSHTRGNRHSPEYTAALLAWLEAHQRVIVNGSAALALEINKVAQIAALQQFGVRSPRTVVVTMYDPNLIDRATKVGFPLILKHNRSGSGKGVRLMRSAAELRAYLDSDEFAAELPIDGLLLAQEYVPVDHIHRLEFIGDKFLYALKIWGPNKNAESDLEETNSDVSPASSESSSVLSSGSSTSFSRAPFGSKDKGKRGSGRDKEKGATGSRSGFSGFCPASLLEPGCNMQDAQVEPGMQHLQRFEIDASTREKWAQLPLVSRVHQMLKSRGVETAGVELVESADGELLVIDVNVNTNYNDFAEQRAGINFDSTGCGALALLLQSRLRDLEGAADEDLEIREKTFSKSQRALSSVSFPRRSTAVPALSEEEVVVEEKDGVRELEEALVMPSKAETETQTELVLEYTENGEEVEELPFSGGAPGSVPLALPLLMAAADPALSRLFVAAARRASRLALPASAGQSVAVPPASSDGSSATTVKHAAGAAVAAGAAAKVAAKKVPALASFMIGQTGAVIAGAATHPVDLVKVRMQLAGQGGGDAAGAAVRRGMLATGVDVVQTEGVMALYKGLSANVARQASFVGTKFGAYDALKRGMETGGIGTTKPKEDGSVQLTFAGKIGAGLGAGAAGAMVGNPADMVMVRMQADGLLPPDQQRNYKHVGHAMGTVVKEEGVTALWRGAGPTVNRAMIVTAAQMACYDQSKEEILKRTPLRDGPAVHMGASLVAGVVAAVFSNPFDVAKTRLMQMSPDAVTGKMPYSGTADCIVKTVSNEGPTAVYKGIAPTIARQVPLNMLRFMCVEQLRNLYLKSFPPQG
uniref:ATP-grasp domain-containing protein n=1 Tax=Chromera velia CCMP2878 TaxID=1169474 RepID=A0A0G4FY07_9ALVE|eukprot:Cvel_3911.t1-p1 / transcript=Cvel_3911.t1 / gene=Cvel_3911 / organism=Chromera_velia_CCMP2878 / gene_product=Mitochondrial uncoupling protein 4, putative / transcript_product=Mitochondrial uncoupling protein 4, putative / location=Cvel_scaffold165:116638-121450(-) / protein_length=908 / sequence_SO=supercontig / SO=protein_coding / is_pseudo=false